MGGGRAAIALLAAGLLVTPAPASATRTEGFEVVGHDPLFARGMNAAPAIFEDFVYVGSRSDGSPQHPHPGVLVVDVEKPEEPEVVGEIGPPNEGNVGETSRELRVWPEQELLMVLNFGCSSIIHACTAGELLVAPTIKFYDLAETARILPSWPSTSRHAHRTSSSSGSTRSGPAARSSTCPRPRVPRAPTGRT